MNSSLDFCVSSCSVIVTSTILDQLKQYSQYKIDLLKLGFSFDRAKAVRAIFRCDFQEVHFISSKRFTKVSSQLEAGIYECIGWIKQSKTYTMSAGNLALGLANDRKICLQSVLLIIYEFLQCVTSAIDPVPAFLI